MVAHSTTGRTAAVSSPLAVYPWQVVFVRVAVVKPVVQRLYLLLQFQFLEPIRDGLCRLLIAQLGDVLRNVMKLAS